jgi:cysteinyl-tRNA synthetase
MSPPIQSKLHVYNTLTRQLDKFEPIHPGRVNMFVCGPTVYDASGIHHGKTYVAYDIIARYLRYIGYSVFYVLNITDIDDRIINRAKENHEDPLTLSERQAQAFYKDMKDLHVNSMNLYAKASDYIPEIINQIQGLIDKKIAYQINDGVYYDISKFPEYGKLSRQNLEQLTVHRVDPDPQKRSPGDFVLWKKQKPGEIAWDSPWGKGRPGWHIEDTAITLTHFGPTYDLHGGGTDLIFPHHEAEIAQAEGLTGKKPLARYWMHTGLLSIKGQEMHKSLGNFIPIQEALQRVGVAALRIFYASTHYRSPLDYTDEALRQAASLAHRFQRTFSQLDTALHGATRTPAAADYVTNRIEEIRREFFKAMNDDFNTAMAMTAFISLVDFSEENIKKLDFDSLKLIQDTMIEFASILGISDMESASRTQLSETVQLLVSLRDELRKKREYALSDQIREQLAKLGVVIEDEAQRQKRRA